MMLQARSGHHDQQHSQYTLNKHLEQTNKTQADSFGTWEVSRSNSFMMARNTHRMLSFDNTFMQTCKDAAHHLPELSSLPTRIIQILSFLTNHPCATTLTCKGGKTAFNTSSAFSMKQPISTKTGMSRPTQHGHVRRAGTPHPLTHGHTFSPPQRRSPQYTTMIHAPHLAQRHIIQPRQLHPASCLPSPTRAAQKQKPKKRAQLALSQLASPPKDWHGLHPCCTLAH